MTRRAPSKRAEEEWELLRAIEEEKVEEELEISLEVLQVSDEEEEASGELGYPGDWGVGDVRSCLHAVARGWGQPSVTSPRDQAPLSLPAGRRRLPRRRQKGADGKHKVLQQEDGEDVPAVQRPSSGDTLCLEGTLSSTLPTAGGEHPARCGWGGFGAGELCGEES